jgi:4-hydroxy-tetrahydrodipicolinate reductase
MKIALLGYGKMGKSVEQIALNRGHSITEKVSSKSGNINLTNVDVAIDFSIPSAAVDNLKQCFNQGIPIVSGTTGWLEYYDEIVRLCKEKDAALLYASNFSLGVNIFFEINKKLSQLISQFPDYKVSLVETHHTQKIDAPSGTAITLAEQIMANSKYDKWSLETDKGDSTIPISAKRINQVPGTHNVNYSSNIDSIQISHTAHSREGFALGAVLAAEWLQGKTGVFTMKDVLNIG